jgi:iron complex outermembrane receptor protein
VESYSQELRLASDGGPSSWVLGLFGSYDAIGFDIIDSKIFDLDYNLFSMQKTTTFAGFGQADWKLSDTLSLTTGVRATHEHRAFRIGVTGDAALGIVGDPAGGSLLAFQVRNKASAFAVSGRLGLNYKPSDDMLIYASLSNGTKSPAYNTGFISFPQAAGPAGLEKIYAAELGIKSTLADGRLRLNGAVFYYRRKDIQGVDFVPNSVPPIQVIRNFGDADTTGFELDTNWRPLDGLTLSGGISVLDAKIVNGNFKGNRLPSAPKFSATFMARYEAETASGWTISPQFDGRYVGERNRSVDGKLSVDIDFIGVPALNNLQFGYWQLNSGL